MERKLRELVEVLIQDEDVERIAFQIDPPSIYAQHPHFTINLCISSLPYSSLSLKFPFPRSGLTTLRRVLSILRSIGICIKPFEILDGEVRFQFKRELYSYE